MSQKPSLFKLDLRVDKKMIKLKVHQEDAMQDLIQRLSKAITWKNIPREKIKGRLEQQFRKFMTQEQLSSAIRSKLSQLLEESKIILVNIEMSKNDMQLNETPFRILQDSSFNTRKQDIYHKHYFDYLAQQSDLNLHYPQRPSPEKKKTTQQQFENIRLRQRLTSNAEPKKDYLDIPGDSSSEILQRKYEAIDRKCEDFITRHEDLRISYNIFKLSKNETDTQEPVLTRNYRNQNVQEPVFTRNYRNQDPQPLFNDQKETLSSYKRQRSHSSGQQQLNKIAKHQTQRVNREIPSESFHDYKVNRYKSYNTLTHQSYTNTIPNTLRGDASSHSLTKKNYDKVEKENAKPLSRNYGETVPMMGQYSSNISGGIKKFHYLS